MRELPATSLAAAIADLPDDDPYQWIQDATRAHRRRHGCGAYTFADGRLLAALARRYQPERVLELGTALGYSACCWADAGSLVDTIDVDPEHVTAAVRNVARAGLDAQITVHQGDFNEVLGDLDGPYDIAFFDGFTPVATLMAAMYARLGRPGLLVVANMTLAGPELGRALHRLPYAQTVSLTGDVSAVLLE